MKNVILQSCADIVQNGKTDLVSGFVLDNGNLTSAPVHIGQLQPDHVTGSQSRGCCQQDDSIIPLAPFALRVNDTQDFLKFFVSDIALDMFLTLHLV